MLIDAGTRVTVDERPPLAHSRAAEGERASA
jgi:hypothetical protein